MTVCPSENPFGLSWGEDGIVFGQPGKGIMRVSPNGGPPDVIVPVQADEAACCPQMLPGGAAVLFTVRKNQDPFEKARVVAHRLDTGARITVIEGGADGRYVSTGHVVYALAGVLLAVPFDAKRLQSTGGHRFRAQGSSISSRKAAVRRIGCRKRASSCSTPDRSAAWPLP